MSTIAILRTKGKVRILERFSHVSGMKVICAENGERVGHVESVVCAGENRVLGFLLDLGTIGTRYGFVCMDDVLSITEGEIRIFNGDSVQKDKRLTKKYRKGGSWNWLHKKAVTPEGRLLGTVSDGLFDVHSGRISEVELSLGVIEDFRDGRRRFSLSEETEFAKEFLVLKDGGKHDE